MRYLLDTNIFIAAMKGQSNVRVALERTQLSDLVLSPVVLGELQLGVEKSAYREKNQIRLNALVQNIGIVPIDARVSQRYALVRADLERQGITIGSNDFWIAAHALALNATLVTDNLAEFNRVEGLQTENWLRN